MITVTVSDNGGTQSGGVNTASAQFTVVVNPVNQPPTLSPITIPAAILENAGTQSLVISGIGSGPGDPVQNSTVTAASGNTGLIPSVGVTYTSPNTLGALSYTLAPNASGTAVITVTVTDDGGLSVQRSLHGHRHAGQPAAPDQHDPGPHHDPREYPWPADDQPVGHQCRPGRPG